MNEYLSGFILGLVQGLTEFLPVSSSGHLLLLESLGVGEPDLATNLMLHLATLLAVCIIYRKQIVYLIKHPTDWRVKFILAASIPTGVIAAVIRYLLPLRAEMLPTCFIATSVILILPKLMKPAERPFENKLILKSLIVGTAQGLACLNGISRSGSTVAALRMCGADAETSAEASFLLSIPVIAASSAVELISGGGSYSFGGGAVLGMVVAFAVGICAIKVFIKMLKKDKIAWFSLYTFLLGITSFILFFK